MPKFSLADILYFHPYIVTDPNLESQLLQSRYRSVVHRVGRSESDGFWPSGYLVSCLSLRYLFWTFVLRDRIILNIELYI